MGKFAMLVKL